MIASVLENPSVGPSVFCLQLSGAAKDHKQVIPRIRTWGNLPSLTPNGFAVAQLAGCISRGEQLKYGIVRCDFTKSDGWRTGGHGKILLHGGLIAV